MDKAGGRTQRVSAVNASWSARGGDDTFCFEVVTEDQARHTIEASPAAAVALIALTQADRALLWDPESRTLTAVNLVGDW